MTEPLCIKQDGIWLVLPYGQPVTSADGIQASYDTVMLWAENGEDWQQFGLARPEPAPPAPTGKVEASRELVDIDGHPAWSVTYQDAPTPPAQVAPDNPTLGDWRVGLSLWTRTDGAGSIISRLEDVTDAVAEMMASSDTQLRGMGAIAHQRLEYSNNVLRAQIQALAPAFKFTADEVEESLWRALRASLGDLSGVWPLPEGEDPFAPPQSAAA